MADQGTQRVDDGEAGAWLPLAEAARQLGVSAKTVRRRLKAGELAARQVATAHGPAYEVWVPAAGPVGREASRVDGQGSQWVDDETTLELVRLVDRFQRENRDLAGLVGSLQQRLVFADERIRALEAPRDSTAAEIVSGEPATNGPVGMARPGHGQGRPGSGRMPSAGPSKPPGRGELPLPLTGRRWTRYSLAPPTSSRPTAALP